MEDPQQFEQEVLRIARFRWPSAEFGGSEIVDGRERDGVFETEDVIHLLEATTSRGKEKALKDLGKLHELYKKYRGIAQGKAIKCWFVTKFEPTADQRACKKEIKGSPLDLFNIVSFGQFQSKLVDSHDYLGLRKNHKFGSICDPKTQNPTAEVPYIEVGLRLDGEEEMQSTEGLANSVMAGRKMCLLGEFGVGKSMTLREIYRFLSKRHFQAKTSKFPIYLNLREHQGQQEPAEILERHGRNIGFPNPSQLVRAWKAGYVILLLDGFDEVSSFGLQGAWRRLKEARKASMTGLRRLVKETPVGVGVAVAGREHFFDTEEERRDALGLGRDWCDIRLDEFGEEQITKLIAQYGLTSEIPPWVPARPLLLSALFARGLSEDATKRLALLADPAQGWDFLLDEVCRREADIDSSDVSGENVRAIIESLATRARSTESGLGPLSPDDIIKVFEAECEFTPTDAALIVLQRLPGLGRDSSSPTEESRAFVDVEFADACRAGDFVRFCADPFNVEFSKGLDKTTAVIGATGLELAGYKLRKSSFSEALFTSVIKACERMDTQGATQADLLGLALVGDYRIRHRLQISKISIDHLDLPIDRDDFGNIVFTDCYFGTLVIPSDLPIDSAPYFQGCLVQHLEGRVTENDLPSGRFTSCFVEHYVTNSTTTNATFDLNIPISARVLVTILKKLFMKSMGGRKENALFRGMDGSHQVKVQPILALLKQYGFIVESGRPGDPVWIPARRLRSRALSIVTAPTTSADPLIVAARKM